MTVLETLKGINSYPIPLRVLVYTATLRGLDLEAESTQEVQTGKAYNLARADLLAWLSIAPDISQGGQSYSFTDEQRKSFRSRAAQLYADYADEEDNAPKAIYGYKGSRL